ncbi:MAG: hypothetical protein IT289_13320 [Oligoflexia bacterium]|nr:hypothetical protein [Oligoflexia bacterium]
MKRVLNTLTVQDKNVRIRVAHESDTGGIQKLFQICYQGKYPLDFGMDEEVLRAEIADHEHYLWLVAEQVRKPGLIGAVMFTFDLGHRLSKAAGGVVLPQFRKGGLGSALLQTGVDFLTKEAHFVDVIYGTTRTISAGPSKMTADVGFHKMGLFPNAVHVESFENLNLDVYLTKQALASRRKKPYLFGPFYEFYNIARKQLGFERAYLVTERAPLKLSKIKLSFELIKNEKEVVGLFRKYRDENRISNSFFPFHSPNWLLRSFDGGTEVFIWYGGVGQQASILGYRTDRVNIHDVLDSVAYAIQNEGAAYVELLVDAYDYKLQQEAYTARYIPSAYFPAMHLTEDGLRDDYFVLSRTFRLLDFTGAYVSPEVFPYLQSYLRCYNELYIQPFLGVPAHGKKANHQEIQI